MMLPEITAVLFDVGGVLVPSDSSNRIFEESIINAFGVEKDFSYDNPRYPFVRRLFHDLETGLIDDREFWRAFADALGKPHVPGLERLFPDVLASGEISPFFRRLIATLRDQGIRTAMVSNTCRSLAERHYRLGHYDLVDVHVLSHEVGFRKPSRAFYLRALDRAHVEASSALLVDDRWDNVAGARELGMHAVHYQGEQPLANELVLRGVLSQTPKVHGLGDAEIRPI